MDPILSRGNIKFQRGKRSRRLEMKPVAAISKTKRICIYITTSTLILIGECSLFFLYLLLSA